jgi:hypothetical protein
VSGALVPGGVAVAAAQRRAQGAGERVDLIVQLGRCVLNESRRLCADPAGLADGRGNGGRIDPATLLVSAQWIAVIKKLVFLKYMKCLTVVTGPATTSTRSQ